MQQHIRFQITIRPLLFPPRFKNIMIDFAHHCLKACLTIACPLDCKQELRNPFLGPAMICRPWSNLAPLIFPLHATAIRWCKWGRSLAPKILLLHMEISWWKRRHFQPNLASFWRTILHLMKGDSLLLTTKKWILLEADPMSRGTLGASIGVIMTSLWCNITNQQTVLLFIINAEMDLLFTTLVMVVLFIAYICRGMATFIMNIGRVLHLQIMKEVANTKGMVTAITSRHLMRPLEEDTDPISHSRQCRPYTWLSGSGLWNAKKIRQ